MKPFKTGTNKFDQNSEPYAMLYHLQKNGSYPYIFENKFKLSMQLGQCATMTLEVDEKDVDTLNELYERNNHRW